MKIGANGHLPSDIWDIVPEDTWRKDSHCAVFPEELLRIPILATSACQRPIHQKSIRTDKHAIVMITKVLKRTPIEIFCHDCGNLSDDFKLAIHQQYCKYIKGTCCKPRKSEPEIKVGICSLGATVAQKNEIQPIIICPQRFKEEVMFDTIRKNYLSHWKTSNGFRKSALALEEVLIMSPLKLTKTTMSKIFALRFRRLALQESPYPAVKEFISNSSFCFQKIQLWHQLGQ